MLKNSAAIYSSAMERSKPSHGSPPLAFLSSGCGTRPPVSVHMFSDIACPWCHIGVRRLQRAARQYKRRYGQAAPLKLHWNPLLVSNDVSTVGEDLGCYAQRRWGKAIDVQQFKSRLVRAGLPEGASFKDWRTMPNSLLAHELVAMAAEKGLAEQTIDMLFTRTYEQGGNVSQLEELLEIAAALGLQPGDHVGRELLRTDEGSLRAATLARDAAGKRRLRIQAVPHFIITAGPNCRTKYSLSGPHQTSDLLSAMEAIAAAEVRTRGLIVPVATSYDAVLSGDGVLSSADMLAVHAQAPPDKMSAVLVC